MRTADGESPDGAPASHLQQCKECHAAVEAWREATSQLSPLREKEVLADCPLGEELAAYSAGLDSEKSGQILDHLARCGRCSAIVSDSVEVDETETLPMLRSSAAAWRR